MKKRNLHLNTTNSMAILLVAVFGLLFPMGLKAEPTEDCDPIEVKISADRTLINEGESVTLTADVCPSGDYTYEWYRNGVSIGTTTDSDTTFTPTVNGAKYTVVVSSTESNEVRILFTSACDGVYTLDNWYGVNSFNICAVDACYTIYKMELNLGNDAHFPILENGTAIANASLVGVNLRIEAGGDGTPAYRNTGGGGTFVYYLDTNTNPYTIYATEPDPPTDPKVKISAAGNTVIPKNDPIPVLTAVVCPDDNGPYIYQWYRNGLAIDPFENPKAVTDQLEDEIPTDDNTKYYVIASNGVDAPLQSNTITITFVIYPIPPTATTPQTFCTGATVSNLQAMGTNIKWYDTPTGETALDPATALIDGNIYYASQTSGLCESETRTAVKVIIDENVIIDAPRITNRQNFCGSATLADIATDGNPNIIWYDAPLNGNQLPLTTPLVDGNLYFAALSAGGTCVSAQRTEVEVSINDLLPDAPIVRSPQHFCKGATLENIAVPNNQILWYISSTGGTPLAAGTILEDGDYYAAQETGECESEDRTAVTISIGTPSAPSAPLTQIFCGSATVSQLSATGTGLVWFNSSSSNTALALTESLSTGTYYVAQSSGSSCLGTRLAVNVTVLTEGLSAPAINPLSQSFCAGATVANIVVPNNQILWYTSSTGGTALSAGTLLTSGTYYAAQSTGSCESSSRTAVTITISSVSAPTGPATQTICGGGTLASLTVNGSGIVWYDSPTGGNLLSVSTPLVTNTIYYASQSSGDCQSSTRLGITVTVTSGLNPPSATTPQTFCDNATVSNLQATGAGIIWYDAATGGNVVPNSTSLESNKTYYAAQSNATCESSTRTAVTAIIDNSTLITPPVINSPQSLCTPATLADIATDGNTNIVWYSSSTSTDRLPLTTAITGSGSYYAAMTTGDCESTGRTEVVITITAANPSAPVISPSSQTFCPGATVANIVVPNDQILWYTSSAGGTALSLGAILSAGTYYASQSAGSCESTGRTPVSITIGSNPPQPTGPTSQTICGDGTLADLVITGSGVIWYSSNTSTEVLPMTTVLSTGNYFAAQSSGNCESSRLQVSVTVLTSGLNPPGAITPQRFCSSATVSNLVATGTGIKWYDSATGGNELSESQTLTDGLIYYAAQSTAECESVTRTAVKVVIDDVTDLEAPAISSPQNICGPATLASIIIPAGVDNVIWYNAQNGGIELPLSTPLSSGTYFAAVRTGGCESSGRTAVVVNLGSTTPTAPGVTSPQSFCLGATVSNIAVPNNQIIWYNVSSGGTPLSEEALLSGGPYYAAQGAGTCESSGRTLVTINIGTPVAPVAPSIQSFCNNGTVADLSASGSSIVWYDVASGGSALAMNTPLTTGTYYAAQSSGNCESIDRLAVTIIISEPSLPIADKNVVYSGMPQYIDSVFVQENGGNVGEKSWITYVYKDKNGTPLAGLPTNAGEYTVRADFAGNNDYCPATASATLTIDPKPIDDATVTVASIQSVTYTGSAHTPEPTVTDTDRNELLVKGADYTLSYTDNINAGTATVTITGTGNYGGTRTVSFVINKLSSVAPPSLPEGLEAVYGDRFRDVSLPSGFSWPNPSSTVGNASSSPVSVTALYNPDPSKYEDYIVVLQLTIHPAQPPREVIFPEADMTAAIIYDPEQTLSSIGLINGSGAGTFSWRYPNTVPTVDRTEYEIVFTPADTDNYDYSGVEGWDARSRTIIRTISLTIVPRDITIDLFCDAAKTYTGLPVELCEAEVTISELRSSTAESIALEYLYYRNGVLQDEAINAGVYEVVARSADVNYSGQSAIVTFTIEKAQAVIVLEDQEKAYTGSPIAPDYEITGSHTASGLSRTLTFTYEGVDGTLYGPTETAPTEIGEYKVHAYTPGSVNHLPAEAEALLKIVSGVGIDQVASETFRIYPNPVSKNSKLIIDNGQLIIDNGQLTIDNERTFVEVYDTNGTLLRKIEVTDAKTEIRSESKEGVYFYVVRTNTGTETVKVVVK